MREDSAARKSSSRSSSVGNTSRRSSLRQRLRGLDRLLQWPGLDESARVHKQRERQALQSEYEERQRERRERQVYLRYKRVRFFERRKIERALHALEQRVAAGEHLDADGRQRLEQLQRDWRYVRHFPRGEKYVALYPSGGHTEASRAAVERWREEIEQHREVASEEVKQRGQTFRDRKSDRALVASDEFLVPAVSADQRGTLHGICQDAPNDDASLEEQVLVRRWRDMITAPEARSGPDDVNVPLHAHGRRTRGKRRRIQ